MSKEFNYWVSVLKRIGYLVIAIFLTFLAFKLSLFYMPFLIAFIISLFMEPGIKKLMKKFKFSRRLSSIIVFIITFGIIIGILIWGVITLASESTNLLRSFNDYYNRAYSQIQNWVGNINIDSLKIPSELLDIAKNTAFSVLNSLAKWIQAFFTNFVSSLTSIPAIAIYFSITILALYFICTDKIYMLDELEHHLPERWMKELTRTHKRTCKSLRRIFKGTSNTYINFIYNISNRPLYNVFLWVKCWISTYYRSWNCLCGCSSNFRFRNCYGTLGNFIWIKWRFKIRFSNNWLMDYYVCN